MASSSGADRWPEQGRLGVMGTDSRNRRLCLQRGIGLLRGGKIARRHSLPELVEFLKQGILIGQGTRSGAEFVIVVHVVE